MSIALSYKTEMEKRLGYLPAYYLPTLNIPSLFDTLWQQHKSGYLNNPLPAQLKEKLLTYLSQGRNLPYAVVCHSCQLYHLGVNSQDILDLLQLPYPTSPDELTLHYRYLAKITDKTKNWQNNSIFQQYLLPCCWLLFQMPNLEQSGQLLRDCLGDKFYGHLMAFMGYIQSYHQWLASYPQISYDQDPHVSHYLPQLLKEEPILKSCLPLESDLSDSNDCLDFKEYSRKEPVLMTDVENLTSSFSALPFLTRSFEKISNYVYLTDAKGEKLQYVNKALLRAFGQKTAKFSDAIPLSTLFSPNEAWELQKHHQKAITQNQPIKSLDAWTFPDGLHHVDVVKLPLTNEKDEIQGILTIANDISEWVEQKEALSRQNQVLEAVNGELESFSAAVSHDLCAPLRAMDGFSQVLYERYSDVLDSKGQHYLQRIRANCQRMGELIEDLLNFSRVGRSSLTKVSVNLSNIAEEVNQTLKEQNPQRDVKIEIETNMKGNGDRHLLKIVLENLLSNAWKYTSHRENAQISVGYCPENQAFFVKDNGAGFDMAYIHRLFSPFQRLHSDQEFAGNGIGLATVARIIHRHGGRIWAQAEVEKGATFYFNLG